MAKSMDRLQDDSTNVSQALRFAIWRCGGMHIGRNTTPTNLHSSTDIKNDRTRTLPTAKSMDWLTDWMKLTEGQLLYADPMIRRMLMLMLIECANAHKIIFPNVEKSQGDGPPQVHILEVDVQGTQQIKTKHNMT